MSDEATPANELLTPLERRIRMLLLIVFVGLIASGATTFALETEMKALATLIDGDSAVARWVARIRDALVDTNAKYPFLAYGTDWLAFAHLVIALAFLGPMYDPIKNSWVVDWGMIACIVLVPFALIAGHVRGIPMGWRLIDCCFGIAAFIPLWLCRRYIRELESQPPASAA
ncbi:MAG: hypothetical protein L0Y58_11110 [Verrucomicrobia subdivision 3 bacterium]|nr:hypothetical protein [Limisphaerales bacterium]